MVEYVLVPQFTQALTAVDPVAVLYVPATQLVQALSATDPVAVLYLPAPQAVHLAASLPLNDANV